MNLPKDASDDQSNCPPDYYRRSNGMLHQIQSNASPSPAPQIDPTALEGMGAVQLRALFKKMPGYPVALLTDDEAAEAMLMRMKIDALDQKNKQFMIAIEKWLDRIKGKAITPIAAQIQIKEDKPIDKRQLAREIDFLLAMAENEGNGVLIENVVENGE